MKNLAILSLIIFIILGCNSVPEMNKSFSPDSNMSTSSEYSEPFGLDEELDISSQHTESQSIKNTEPNSEKESKIIKEGNMHIEVENLSFSKNYIDSIVHGNKAYYENEIFRNSDYFQNYSLKIRIPSQNFSSVIAALELGGGKILEKNINAKDVTEEYLDLEIRLDNNRAYLKRYNELLIKAKSISDMLEIQEKIRQIELLVDGNIGRIKYLTDRANYSTLSLELTTKPEARIADAPPTFFDEIIDAFKNGFSGLLYFILILANLWPIVFIILLIWMFRNKMFGLLKRQKNRFSN